MARPTNSIANIKMPGESTQRPIVPYAIGVSNNNSYQATLPNLTKDVEIIVNALNQAIDGQKTFHDEVYFGDANNNLKGKIHFWDIENGWWWEEQITDDLWSMACSNTYFIIDMHDGIFTWHNRQNNTSLNYTFPAASGTLGLQIDIVDLT